MTVLLVVEDDVWQPYPVAGDPDAIDAAEVFGIPHEQLVAPLLIQPHVCRHHLVLLILEERAGNGKTEKMMCKKDWRSPSRSAECMKALMRTVNRR